MSVHVPRTARGAVTRLLILVEHDLYRRVLAAFRAEPFLHVLQRGKLDKRLLHRASFAAVISRTPDEVGDLAK